MHGWGEGKTIKRPIWFGTGQSLFAYVATRLVYPNGSFGPQSSGVLVQVTT